MPSTVDRVLPWRRSSPPPAEELAPLLSAYRDRHGRSARTELITRAYLTASAAHDGQIRKTGEAYIHHPIAVARIVAHLGLDDVTIANDPFKRGTHDNFAGGSAVVRAR